MIVVFLVTQTNWPAVLNASPGPWDTGVLAMLSIVIAATGIGWINAGADYARYLPHKVTGRSIAGWTVLGSTIPLFVLILTGRLLATHINNLATSNNPVLAIGNALPSWMAIPYLITAIGGLVVEADLSIYSSGLNLLTMGLNVDRYKTVVIDGILMIAGSVYVMLVAQNFFGPFESFLQLLADGLMAWSAVFLVDMIRRRRYDTVSLANTGTDSRYFYQGGVSWAAIIAWVLGILVGLAFTVSPWFSGPFAIGIFASSSLGYLIGFVVSALAYWGLITFFTRGHSIAENEERVGELQAKVIQ